MAGSELVHLSVDGLTATITLDSPANRNALSRQLVAELVGHLETATARDDVRVVVLTHTGSTFCAGADLREAREQGMEQGTRTLLDLLRRVVLVPKPVIAVVRGHVRAGGVGLVGACDLAITTDTSTYAFTESRLGLAPAIISLTTRSRLADRDAAWLYLTGETFDGAHAAAVGLVSQCVSVSEVEAALDNVMQSFRAASPQGLRETKSLLNADLLARFDRYGDELVALSGRLFASEEAAEGMRAFAEKRAPGWLWPAK